MQLAQLLCEIENTQKKQFTIYKDNQCCIAMIKSEIVSQRFKHFDVRYCSILELYKQKL